MGKVKLRLWDKMVLTIVIGYLIFHILIMLQIIPSDIVWGGRIIAPNTVLLLEGVALLLLLFLGLLILMKIKVIRLRWQDKTLNNWLIVFSIYFVLNTITNLMATTTLEKAQALLTVLLAIGLFKMSERTL